MHTNVGDLNLELHCDITPRTCENFLGLAAQGYYNGTAFHRSIKNFMIQVRGVATWPLGSCMLHACFLGLAAAQGCVVRALHCTEVCMAHEVRGGAVVGRACSCCGRCAVHVCVCLIA